MKESYEAIIKRIERLEGIVLPKARGEKLENEIASSVTVEYDFELNERAFFKRYAIGMSGAKKLTLSIAYLSKGEAGEKVQRTSIEKTWNSVAAFMGGKFSGIYTTRAKENGWIDSKEKGVFYLTKNWEEINNVNNS